MSAEVKGPNIFEMKRGSVPVDICDVPRQAVVSMCILPDRLKALTSAFVDPTYDVWFPPQNNLAHRKVESEVHRALIKELNKYNPTLPFNIEHTVTTDMQSVKACLKSDPEQLGDVGWVEYREVDDTFWAETKNGRVPFRTKRGYLDDNEPSFIEMLSIVHSDVPRDQWTVSADIFTLYRSLETPQGHLIHSMWGRGICEWQRAFAFDVENNLDYRISTFDSEHFIEEIVWYGEYQNKASSAGLALTTPKTNVPWKRKIICFDASDIRENTVGDDYRLIQRVNAIGHDAEKMQRYKMLVFPESSAAKKGIEIIYGGDRYSGNIRYKPDAKSIDNPYTIVATKVNDPRTNIVIGVEQISFHDGMLHTFRPSIKVDAKRTPANAPPKTNIDAIFGSIVLYNGVVNDL